MKISTHVVVLACGALLAPAVRAYDLPVFALGEMRTAPVIDGRVGADEWADAMKTLQFIPLRKDLAFPGEAQVWLGRDRERLFVAARMIVSPHGLVRGPGPVKRRGNGGMLGAFNGDCFEFDFIDNGTATKDSGRHMIVSSTGCYYSSGTDEGHPIAWDPPGFATASTVTNGFWEFEFSIPLEEAGFTAANAAKHAVRIARNWKYMGTGWGIQSSLTPQESVFEKSAGCAKTPFDAAAPVVQVDDIGLHGHGGENYADHYPVKFRVRNPTAAEMPLKVRVLGRPVESQPMMMEMPVTLKPGEERAFAERGAVLSDEKVTLEMSVTSADGATVYYTRKFEFQPNFPAIPWLRHDAKDGGVEVKMAYYPSFNKLRARADLSSDKTRGPRAAVTFAVLGKDGRTLASVPAQADRDGVADLIFDVPDLAAETKASGSSDYRLVTTVPGIGAWTNAFVRHVCEWEGNKYGLSGVVPPPFEKVKVRGEGEERTVSVILRDHVVDKDTGLWKQVTAAGKDLLARPMQLVAARPESAPYHVETTWDVDGCYDWRLTLKKGHHEPMRLEIPIRAERAKLLHSVPDGCRISYSDKVPEGTGCVWKSSQVPHVAIIGDYIPYIWVGGPLRGIAVFGDNDRGWVNGEKPHQEIVREADGTVVVRLNLVQCPVDLEEDRTIRIGFMATPTKPMEENWRARDPGVFFGSGRLWGSGQTDSSVRPFDGTGEVFGKLAETARTGKIDEDYLKRVFASFPYAGAPGTDDRRHWERYVQTSLRSGFNHCKRWKLTRPYTWYTNARGVDFSFPDAATFCDEWSRQEWMWTRDFGLLSHRDYDGEPCGSNRDFSAWWWRKMFESGACQNMYWDVTYPDADFDLVGTDAYRMSDGTIQPSCGLFNMRELVRRCAMVQAELGMDWRGNWVHMTSTALAPVLSFGGLNFDLEDGGSVSDFQDRYGREYLLASAIGRQHGNPVSAMGYFGKTTPAEKARLDRCGTGVMLVHEIIWGYSPSWRAIDAKLRDWGYRRDPSVRVWNDFDEDVAFPVALAGERAYALAMTHPVRKAGLVVVCDWADGGTVEVRPDFAAMGLAADVKAFDFETGAELPLRDGAVSVSLKKHDFAIMEFRR